MAYKTLNTRIQLKYFEHTDLSAVANKVLLKGEVAAVHIPTGTKTITVNGETKTVQTNPTVLFKVGDGTMGTNGVATGTAFKDLPWLSALAADVHDWAKKDWNGFVADVQANAGLVTADAFDEYTAALEALIGTEADELTADTIFGKIAELEDIADTNTTNIATLNGGVNVTGSVAAQVAVAKKAADDAQNAAEGAQSTADEALAKAEANATAISKLDETYATDSALETAQTTLQGNIDKKVDADKVYTTTQADAKFETIANANLIRGRLDTLEAFKNETVPTNYATKTEVNTAKSGAEATAKAYTDEKLDAFVAAYITDDGGTIDKLNEIADWINNDEAGVAEIIKDIDDLAAAVDEINKKELTDTTYTFASGSQGQFTVTPEGGTAQTIDTGAKTYTDTAVSTAIGKASEGTKAATGIHAVIEAGDAALQEQIDDIEELLENSDLTDTNTTYTFTDGTEGKFTVAGSDGSSKVVNTGAKAYVDGVIGTATNGDNAATGLHAVIEAADANLQDQIDDIEEKIARFGDADDILILNGGTASTVW